MQHRRGNHARAESLFHQALAMRRGQLRSGHPNIAQSLRGLALVLRDEGDHARAEAHLLEALEIYRGSFDETDGRMQEVYADLVDLYTAWSRPGEAARYRALLNP